MCVRSHAEDYVSSVQVLLFIKVDYPRRRMRYSTPEEISDRRRAGGNHICWTLDESVLHRIKTISAMGVFMELRVVLLSLLQSPVSVLSRKPANTQNPGGYDSHVLSGSAGYCKKLHVPQCILSFVVLSTTAVQHILQIETSGKTLCVFVFRTGSDVRSLAV